MKNTLQRLNSRLDKSKDKISSLEDYIAGNSSSEQQRVKENPKKHEDSFRSLWNNIIPMFASSYQCLHHQGTRRERARN